MGLVDVGRLKYATHSSVGNQRALTEVESGLSLRYSFTFSCPKKGSVLVLNLHLSQFLGRSLTGLDFVTLQLESPVVHLRPRFVFELIRALCRHRRMVAWIIAVIRTANAKVVVSMDNFNQSHGSVDGIPLMDELSMALKDVAVVVVQHGQDLRRQASKKTRSNVELLCWGRWTAENFPKFGRTEGRYTIVGPLIDGLYRQARPKVIEKDVHLTLISTVKDDSWWGNTLSERRIGYEVLVEYVDRFAAERNLEIFVALTIDRDHDGNSDEPRLEREWFERRLVTTPNFPDQTMMFGGLYDELNKGLVPKYIKERYGTYYLSDRSRVTIGMSSSVLWESFGRGNRVLSVNMTSNEIYDFPISGPWSLQRPSYERFAQSLESLLEMSDDEWTNLSQDAATHLVFYDPKIPPDQQIQHVILDRLEHARNIG